MNLAMEMHCQTGLNFLVDTSRNGGLFSDRSLDDINECTYDPPYIAKGSTPGWGNGARNKNLNRASGDPTFGGQGAGFNNIGPANYGSQYPGGGGISYNYQYEYGSYGRKKRSPWEFHQAPSVTDSYDSYDGYDYYSDVGTITDEGAYEDPYGLSEELLSCISGMGGHDGNAWVKTPGEADGRMYNSGVYQPCLLGHSIECTDQCPQYIPKFGEDFQRVESCQCG